MLTRSPFIQVVGTARDGREALEPAVEKRPDVITRDLSMPEMDGVARVREQMLRQSDPDRRHQRRQSLRRSMLAALEPWPSISFRIRRVCERPLGDGRATRREGQGGRDGAHAPKAAVVRPAPAPARVVRVGGGQLDVIAIGILTGGPQGLKSAILRLPARLLVPVGILLHMPIGHT